MTIQDISNVVKEGLIKGYRENLSLISSYNDFTKEVREYLLTVNVAQKLLEWDEHHNYKTRLEYSVLNFYNNAFVKSKMDGKDIFSLEIINRKIDHAPTNKHYQKVDIVITQEQNEDNAGIQERSLVGIELKGINQADELILKDVRRLANAMCKKDAISENSVRFCISGFLRRFDIEEKMVTEGFVKEQMDKEETKWKAFCARLGTEFTDLKFDIELFPVINTTASDISKYYGDDSDYFEIAMNTGSIVAGILKIERK